MLLYFVMYLNFVIQNYNMEETPKPNPHARKCKICGKTDQRTYIDLKKKVIKKEHLKLLLENGYIKETNRGNICMPCLDTHFPDHTYNVRTKKRKLEADAASTSRPTTSQSATDTRDDQDISPEIDRIKACLEPLLKRDTTALQKQGKPSFDELVEYNVTQWLQNRPKQLIELLKSICGIDIFDDKKSYLLAKVVEQIYYIRNSRLILPLSFRESLVLYTLTYSKSATTLSCKTTPGGSYKTINGFLSNEAADPILMSSGNMRCAFDNNQIIGKTYMIKGDNKVPTSIMTSTSFVKLDESKIQEDSRLKPENWMWEELSDEQKEMLVSDNNNEFEYEFRRTRNIHIAHHLRIVESQIGDSKTDYIDKHITDEISAENEKVCVDCGSENDVNYRVCRVCFTGSLQKATPPDVATPASFHEKLENHISYKESVQINENQATVQPGEPQFVNPNSYQTIISVIRCLGQQAGIRRYGGTEREWLFLECDGLPYKILRDIMDNVFRCKRCGDSFYGMENFECDEHRCYRLAKEECIQNRF